MRVPLNWLKKYLVGEVSNTKIIKALQMAGIEIEQIESPKAFDAKIVTATIKKIEQLPGSDHLKLATVSDGRSTYQVVCGGPNAALGQRVVLAKVGAKLPDGTVISERSIRGQKSAGMLASASELGLGDDHEGIIELDAQTPLGRQLRSLWSQDIILDIKTPAANRSDLQSILGLAREAAAQLNRQANLPKIARTDAVTKPYSGKVKVEAKTSRYMLAELSLPAKLPVTPDWMSQRLRQAGLRPIHLVVDITNYVMLELGQPLHAFNAPAIKGQLKVRLAKSDEGLIALDGRHLVLTQQDLVIADSQGPIALAGVVGGARAEVKADTRRILLESASFDSTNIRQTALRFGLRTEASARFERNLPVQLAHIGMARAVYLLQDIAGAKLQSRPFDEITVWPWVQHIGVRPAKLSQWAGAEVKPKQIVNAVRRLGFEAEEFDIAKEARKHLGKPYVWGARYKTHQSDAFDCGYLVDYIYSLIGRVVGHTVLGIYSEGYKIEENDLKPGDTVYKIGNIPDDILVKDHYYYLDPTTRKHIKKFINPPKRIGHIGLYIGKGKVIHADAKSQKVVEAELEEFKGDDYVGVRRHLDNLSDYIAVTVPWWRPDVKTEHDILEEVVRILGYDKLPSALPHYRAEQVLYDRWWPRFWQVQDLLKGVGLFEVNTYSFVSAKQLEGLGLQPKDHLKLKNPLSQEQAYLRSSLLPGLLAAAAANQRYADKFGIFEIAAVFRPTKPGKLPQEPQQLGVLAEGGREPYRQVKAVLDALQQELNARLSIHPANIVGFHPGRSAWIQAGNNRIGRLGQIHPEVSGQFGLDEPASYLELDFNALLVASQPKNYQPLSRFPAAVRDLSLLVKRSTTWKEIEKVILEANLAEPTFLSDYYGTELGADLKTIAVRLTMTDPEKTLSESEINHRVEKILKALQKQTGAEPRA